jgi:hypothetical protein
LLSRPIGRLVGADAFGGIDELDQPPNARTHIRVNLEPAGRVRMTLDGAFERPQAVRVDERELREVENDPPSTLSDSSEVIFEAIGACDVELTDEREAKPMVKLQPFEELKLPQCG